MTTPYPRVDDRLVHEVLQACGVDRDAGVERITIGFRGWLPAGSTAKWSAIDGGAAPPGADPSTALEARLSGSLESWSCWPLCSGLGAVLAGAGHDVRLAVEQLRSGRHVPVVDYHSVLVVDGALLDPYLGPSAPIALGADVTRPDAWGAWIPGTRPDHLGAKAGGWRFRYRLLADHLDARDVRAFCAISETHSGIGRRRTAHWVREGKLWSLREGDDGMSALRVTEGSDPFTSRRRLHTRGPFRQLQALVDAP